MNSISSSTSSKRGDATNAGAAAAPPPAAVTPTTTDAVATTVAGGGGGGMLSNVVNSLTDRWSSILTNTNSSATVAAAAAAAAGGGNYKCNAAEARALCVSAEINGIFDNLNLNFGGGDLAAEEADRDEGITHIESPCVVVFGGQSSGKSSTLNRIIGRNVLNVRKNITTRTPWDIRCESRVHPELGTECVEFGQISDGRWCSTYRVDMGKPGWEQLVQDRGEVETRTRAGRGFGISASPVIIKIYSPGVPNLAIIDLPGLTSVPLAGQSNDTPEQLEALALKYVRKAQATILVFLTAHDDLETQPILKVLKKSGCDPTGDRSLGVITKVDMIDSDGGDVGSYLDGGIDDNLKFSHGYYAVCNKPPSITASGGGGAEIVNVAEVEYFTHHKVYGNLNEESRGRMGVAGLRRAITELSARNIRRAAPKLREQTRQWLKQTSDRQLVLGPGVPTEEVGAMGAVNQLLNQLANQYSDMIGRRNQNSSARAGREIFQIFHRYLSVIDGIQPFADESVCSNEYIRNARLDVEGVHISSDSPPMILVEDLITTAEQRPLEQLCAPSIKCVDECVALLRSVIDELLTKAPLSSYPKLVALVHSLMSCHFHELRAQLVATVRHLVKVQEYVFLAGHPLCLPVKKQSPENSVREMCADYFHQLPSHDFKSMVPRYIMCDLVKQSEELIGNLFRQAMYEQNKGGDGICATELLMEKSTVATERRTLDQRLKALTNVESLLNSIL